MLGLWIVNLSGLVLCALMLQLFFPKYGGKRHKVLGVLTVVGGVVLSVLFFVHSSGKESYSVISGFHLLAVASFLGFILLSGFVGWSLRGRSSASYLGRGHMVIAKYAFYSLVFTLALDVADRVITS